ncbi:MAG: zinc-binding dehydrogenase [Ignavibacteriae bacterium]|nr:zinc-binding dehydrogenase [Ignavibacteriota bacterium]
MRAVVVDPSAAQRLVITSVPDPQPRRDEALVSVTAVSLNAGELRRSLMAPAGWRPGWDFAGTVSEAAADGSSPAAGTRVVGFLEEGAWGEMLAAPGRSLAVIPDTVSDAVASTLPVAGMTALYALEEAGSLLGKKVLVTGASGGVGHFAVRLAALAGASVTAVIRNAIHTDEVREGGAHEVLVTGNLEEARAYGPFDHIVDCLGGTALSTAVKLLVPGGAVVTYGVDSGEPTVLEPAAMYAGRSGVRIIGLMLLTHLRRVPPSEGLTRLLRLVADGRLAPRISREAAWTDIADVAAAFRRRELSGKAVLHITG